ncbi:MULTISPECIES: hypothetical protein [Kitasatospora]|uniref:Uncharacterized protein n=1 Tax=Kitasatospora setae (strain ATCC 33774 / DSM 43861 / JCM 3304 / KCC A-0304 / NBRC 14216 / KM-6054) TaxID=452652 RepID=E4N5Z4_KITSK|nr:MULTISPECIES: hypothetical protein [Kitasatospora]BAJ26625.1 hypothetical protein KSE_07860 [Kitasatospora setae KM-6054]
MAHPVLALGTAALTATGSAWSLPALPALLDLRAGPDRPRAARLTAAGCLAWWGALAATALLLTTPLPWPVPLGAALTGTLGALALRAAAGAERRAARREQARLWGAPGPALPCALPYELPAAVPPRHAPAVGWLTTGLAAVAAGAAATLLAGRPGPAGSAVLTVAASAGLCLLIVLVALHRPGPR